MEVLWFADVNPQPPQETLLEATHWTYSTSTQIDLFCVHINILSIILITQLVSDTV